MVESWVVDMVASSWLVDMMSSMEKTLGFEFTGLDVSVR